MCGQKGTYSRAKVESGRCYGSWRQIQLLKTAQYLRWLSGRWRESKIELHNFGSVHRPGIDDFNADVGASNREIRVREVRVRETCVAFQHDANTSMFRVASRDQKQ